MAFAPDDTQITELLARLADPLLEDTTPARVEVVRRWIEEQQAVTVQPVAPEQAVTLEQQAAVDGLADLIRSLHEPAPPQ